MNTIGMHTQQVTATIVDTTYSLSAKAPGAGHYVNLKRASQKDALATATRLLDLGWVVCVWRNSI